MALPRGSILLVGLALVAAAALVQADTCPFLYKGLFPGCADCQAVTITKQVWQHGQLVNKTFTKQNCTTCVDGYLPTSFLEGGKKITVCQVCDLANGYGYTLVGFSLQCALCSGNTVPLTLKANIKIAKVNGTCVSQLRDPNLAPPAAKSAAATYYSPRNFNKNVTIPASCKQFVPLTCTACPTGSAVLDGAPPITCYNSSLLP